MKRLLFFMVLSCPALTGCGGPFFLVGNVVNAAGTAIMEQQYQQRLHKSDNAHIDEGVEEMLRSDAKQGDSRAQYELGLFYLKKGESRAGQWICEAASNGYPEAQLLMGHWFNEDRNDNDQWPFITTRPDDRYAYLWYSLADASGEYTASLFLQDLQRKRMTAEEIDQSRQWLAAWQPRGCGATVLTGPAY
jgi:TPR repeat protein